MSDRTDLDGGYRRQTLINGFADYHIPAHMHDGVLGYVLAGRPSGGFLMALLEGDYMRAAGAADASNRYAFHGWFSLLWSCFPSGSYGSPAAVATWVKMGGLNGSADVPL